MRRLVFDLLVQKFDAVSLATGLKDPELWSGADFLNSLYGIGEDLDIGLLEGLKV